MNFYESEMKKFFGNKEVLKDQKYTNRAMLARLDDDLRVKLYFDTRMQADNYCGIMAKVINRTEGVVDSQFFKFSDIIGGHPDRNTNCFANNIHIYENYGKPYWYGYTPDISQYKEISDRITDYVSMYLEESEDMSMTM